MPDGPDIPSAEAASDSPQVVPLSEVREALLGDPSLQAIAAAEPRLRLFDTLEAVLAAFSIDSEGEG